MKKTIILAILVTIPSLSFSMIRLGQPAITQASTTIATIASQLQSKLRSCTANSSSPVKLGTPQAIQQVKINEGDIAKSLQPIAQGSTEIITLAPHGKTNSSSSKDKFRSHFPEKFFWTAFMGWISVLSLRETDNNVSRFNAGARVLLSGGALWGLVTTSPYGCAVVTPALTGTILLTFEQYIRRNLN